MSDHYDPPKRQIEYWCDECGLKQWRDENPKRTHRVHGEICTGNVTKAEYMLVRTTPILNVGRS